MKVFYRLAIATVVLGLGAGGPAWSAEVCQGYGPQTPRDISSKAGTNKRLFNLAPAAEALNLCNIHFHNNAEHKGPGFKVFAGADKHGGYQCNGQADLTAAELKDPSGGHGACHGVKPGDTVEVHWVHTSCETSPGPGLGSCLSDACANPQLRVETQVFLVVNDKSALNFADYSYGGNKVKTLHQAKGLPSGTGSPVEFLGSTTGPKYTEKKCSPLQVTWSVRPSCAKVDISSLHEWCKGNVFKEDHAHGVRQLVTSPELLSKIQ